MVLNESKTILVYFHSKHSQIEPLELGIDNNKINCISLDKVSRNSISRVFQHVSHGGAFSKLKAFPIKESFYSIKEVFYGW